MKKLLLLGAITELIIGGLYLIVRIDHSLYSSWLGEKDFDIEVIVWGEVDFSFGHYLENNLLALSLTLFCLLFIITYKRIKL